MENQPIVRKFRMAARAAASALFRPGEQLNVTFLLDGAPITLTLRTRYLKRGSEAEHPGDVWLDAEGEAPDIQAAASRFSNAGRDIAALVALCANATIAPIEPEIIFEITPGAHRRQFFQRFIPAERMAYTSRFVDIAAASAVVTAAATHEQKDRLVRAVSQPVGRISEA